MSVEAMAIALHHSRATGTARLILVGIASHDGDGGAWPSIATLAKYGNCTARNAQRAIAKLVELGEIRVLKNQGGNARTPDHTRPNLYEFLLTCGPDCDRSKQHRSRYELTELSTPLTPASPPDASVTGPLTPASPELPKKHPNQTYSNKPTAVTARATVQPAPKYPHFEPDPPKPEIAPELVEKRDAAHQLTCTAHGGKFRHMVDLEGVCARCGLDVDTILANRNEQENVA